MASHLRFRSFSFLLFSDSSLTWMALLSWKIRAAESPPAFCGDTSSTVCLHAYTKRSLWEVGGGNAVVWLAWWA